MQGAGLVLSEDVPLEIGPLRGAVQAHGALVRLLARVCSHVFAPIAGVEEGFSAHPTPIKSPAQMVLNFVAEKGGVARWGEATIHFYAYHGGCRHTL